MTTPVPGPGAVSRPWLGAGLVLMAGSAFAINVVVAPMIYASGVDPKTLVWVRGLGFASLMFGFLLLTGRPLMLARAGRNASIVLGLLFCIQAYAYFKSISLIPVSIATLIEYTYPLQIALYLRLTGKEALSPMRLAAVMAALVGLVLALRIATPAGAVEATGRAIDPVGLAFIIVASVLTSVMVLTGHHAVQQAGDSRRVTLHSTATLAVLYSLMFLVTDLAPAWPETSLGWFLLLTAPLVYMVGILGFFTGLGMIGPVRAGMLGNSEPVMTIAFAILLLGEMLTPWQLFGGALIIGGMIASQMSGRR